MAPANHKKPVESFTKSYINVFLIVLLFILILSIIILSWVPPISRDALTHHLAVPKLYLKHGGIYEIPTARFSFYPMNLDLLYMIPLYFGNDIIPKLIHFTFALLTAGLIYGYLKNRTDVTWALLGALFFLSIPIIVKLSITVYVDLGLVFFSTASLLLLLKWVENHYKLKYLIASAVACGLALGTKYNGLIPLLLLTSLVPLIYMRHTHQKTKGQMKALAFGALFLLIALTIFSPWMIRNYKWQKNPVYPLYNSWFQSIGSEGSPSISNHDVSKPKRGPGHFVTRKIVYGESWWETLSIPVRIFFQGQDDNPKYFDGKLNPFLLFLPIFAFINRKKGPIFVNHEKKIFVFFSGFFLLFAFLQTDMRIRWVSPMLPPLVILSVLGLYDMNVFSFKRSTIFRKKIIAVFVYGSIIALFTINFMYIFRQFHYVAPLPYITGKISRDDYIERFRPEYTAIKFANQNIPDNAKILGVFLGNRGYYNDREMVFDYNKHIRDPLKKTGSVTGLLNSFQNRGITHLLIRYDLFNKWKTFSFNELERQILNNFFKKNTVLLFTRNGHGLFHINTNRADIN